MFRAYAAVFDGHNGASAAEHAADRLHHVLAVESAIRTCTGGQCSCLCGACGWLPAGQAEQSMLGHVLAVEGGYAPA